MGFYENGLERIAAVCVGSASIALGGFGVSGVLETSIGAAGLAGFVLGKNKKFGPECSRVQKRIREKLLSDYQDFIKVEGDKWLLAADLEAANKALNDTLADCFFDRKKLAAIAVTVSGFPDGAAAILFEELEQKHPALFAANKSDTIAYRYARDVIQAGVEAAVEDPDYYRKLEPILMLEMASSLGIIHAAVDAVRDDIRSLQSTIDVSISRSEKRLDKMRDELWGIQIDEIDPQHFSSASPAERTNIGNAYFASLNAGVKRCEEIFFKYKYLLSEKSAHCAPALVEARMAIPRAFGEVLDYEINILRKDR